MNIEYTKMQGLGNDFIIIDNRKYNFSEEILQSLAAQLCRRRLSIGADGLMAVENSEKQDFMMKYYNSDGSVGEMCGNGARCIIRYAYEKKICEKDMSVETISGILEGKIISKRKVSVKLNKPTVVDLDRKVTLKDEEISISYVELGNPGLPHCMVEYKDLDNIDVKDIKNKARELRYSDSFPKGANVNFFKVNKDKSVLIKTYERGVEDFTLACGTGAASTALTVYLKNLVESSKIRLAASGGELEVEVVGEGKKYDLYLIGDTNMIAEGLILDEDLNIGDE
jgi:diaminopimelate epimerase